MRFACTVNVWLWTQLKFIFHWLPGLSEGHQITVKDPRDMCFHLIKGGPPVRVTRRPVICLRRWRIPVGGKNNSVFVEGAAQQKKGGAIAGLDSQRGPRGDQKLPRGQRRSWGATLETKWWGETFLDATHRTPLSCPLTLPPGNLVPDHTARFLCQFRWCDPSGVTAHHSPQSETPDSNGCAEVALGHSPRWRGPWLRQLLLRPVGGNRVWSLQLQQKYSKRHLWELWSPQRQREGESEGAFWPRLLDRCSKLTSAFVPVTTISQPFIWPLPADVAWQKIGLPCIVENSSTSISLFPENSDIYQSNPGGLLHVQEMC